MLDCYAELCMKQRSKRSGALMTAKRSFLLRYFVVSVRNPDTSERG
jgi:hypothetical protein